MFAGESRHKRQGWEPVRITIKGVEDTAKKKAEKAPELIHKNSKFEERIGQHLDQIKTWVEKGAVAAEISRKLDIPKATFDRYVSKGKAGIYPYTALASVMQEGAIIPDDDVEAAMFRRCCGIYWDEKTYETRWNESKEEWEEIMVKRVTKYIPPDPTSCMFWLANRRRGKWQYRPGEQENDKNGESGVILMPEVKGANGK